MPRDKRIIQFTQGQLDRFTRNLAIHLAKSLIGDSDIPDGRVYNLTQLQAAKYINADVSVVRRLLRDKQITGKLVGRRVMHCEEELTPFIKEKYEQD